MYDQPPSPITTPNKTPVASVASKKDLRIGVEHSDKMGNNNRDGFKTQPAVDRRFRPVPGGCHCLEQ